MEHSADIKTRIIQALSPIDPYRVILFGSYARVDSRIEPHSCGVTQWKEDDISAIIETARREGLIITAARGNLKQYSNFSNNRRP